MENQEETPTACKAIRLVDEVIERLTLYLARDKQPSHTVALETMIADLKQVKRLVKFFENKESLERATSLELCNRLFSRLLRRLNKEQRHFPFGIYKNFRRIFVTQ